MSDPDETVIQFATQQGLTFNDQVLLRTALTHRSYLNEHPELGWEDNERMEFLGDAVLDFLLAEYLYRRLPGATEGELTGLRAALVKRQTLAGFAHEMALGEFLLMGHGEVETGGRRRQPTLCAAFEALVGAVYLDRGLDGVRALVMPLIERELADAQVAAEDKDPKSRLQELAQGMYSVTPRYRTIAAAGPDHAKIFTVQVSIGDHVCGEGIGPSKQTAAQAAAVDALRRQDEWPPYDLGAGGPLLEP